MGITRRLATKADAERYLTQQLYQFEELSPAVLEIPDWQRALRREKVRAWSQDYDRNAVGVLDVWYSQGKYYVLDGQHRLALARAVGEKKLPCKVFYSLEAAEARHIFVLRNTAVLRTTIRDAWPAMLQSGDPTVTTITECMEQVGFAINTKGGRTRFGYLSCMQTLVDLYNLGGTPLIVATLYFLKTMEEAWGEDALIPGGTARTGCRAMSATCVGGLGRFLFEKERNIDRDAMTYFKRKLSTYTVNRIIAIARQRYQAANELAFARSLVDIYNSGKRNSDKRLTDMALVGHRIAIRERQ